MKKYLSCLVAFLIFTIIPSGNLSAYMHETIDETIITSEWPALHRSLLKRDFNKVMQILEIYPIEAQIYVKANLLNLPAGWFPEEMICTFFRKHMGRENLNCQGKISKLTSLEIAILSDAPLEIIEKLIALEANPNHERLQGSPISDDSFYLEFRTPLLAACIQQNYEVIQLLLDSGADPEKVVYEGYGWPHYRDDPEAGRSLSGIKFEGNWKNLNDLMEVL